MNEQTEINDEGDLNAQFSDLEPGAAEALQAGTLGETTADEAEGQEKEEYSKRVTKRIGKEVSKRKKMEAERDAYRNRFEEMQTELADFKKEEKGRLEITTKELQDRATTALEEGNTEEFTNLNSQVMDNKVSMARSEPEPFRQEPAAAAPEEESHRAGAAQGWLDDNGWADADSDDFDANKAQRAQRIEQQLTREGYSVKDPATYEELDLRMNPKMGDRKTSTAHVPGRETSPPAAGTKRLSQENLHRMEQYGMNPHDPEHRKEWLAAKGM